MYGNFENYKTAINAPYSYAVDYKCKTNRDKEGKPLITKLFKGIDEVLDKPLNNHTYEIVKKGGFLFFDLDKYAEINDDKHIKKDVENGIKYILGCLGVSVKPRFVWSHSVYEHKIKYSRHLVIKNIYISDWVKINYFIASWLSELVEEKNILDLSIYTRNRQIRMEGCCKLTNAPMDGIKTRLKPSKYSFKDTLISREPTDKDIIISEIPDEYRGKYEKATKRQTKQLNIKRKVQEVVKMEDDNMIYYIDDLRKDNIKDMLMNMKKKAINDKLTKDRRDIYEEKKEILRSLKSIDGYDIYDYWRSVGGTMEYDEAQWRGYYESNSDYWSPRPISYTYIINNKTFFPTAKYTPLDIKRYNDDESYLTHTLNERYISEEGTLKALSKKVSLFVSPTGTGKTTCSLKIFHEKIKQHDSRILSLSCRRTQAEEHKRVFKRGYTELDIKGLPFVSYMDTTKNGKPINEGWKDNKYFICQVDSLKQFTDDDLKAFKGCVLYLDEVRSCLSYLLTSTTMNNCRMKVLKVFEYLLLNCSCVLGLDADINDDVVDYFDSIFGRDELYIYINTIKYETGKKLTICKNEKKFIKRLYKDICDKRPFTMCCDRKTRPEVILNQLKELFESSERGDWEKHIDGYLKVYSADTTDIMENGISDVNILWEGKGVIYTPKITTGIDFNPKEPQTVYVLSHGGSISPLEIQQQTARNRKISGIVAYIKDTTQQIRYTDYKDYETNFLDDIKKVVCDISGGLTVKDINEHPDEEGIVKMETIDNDFYNKVFSLLKTDITMDDDGNFKYKDMSPIEKANQKLFLRLTYINTILHSDIYYHISKILQNKGFTIKYDLEDPSLELKNDKTIPKEIKDNIFNDFIKGTANKYNLLSETIRQRIDILKLDDDQLERYKDYLIDDRKYRGLLVTLNFISTEDKRKERTQEKFLDDTTHNYISTTTNKIYYIDKLKDILKINLYEPIEGMKDIDYKEQKNELSHILKMLNIKDKGIYTYHELYKHLYSSINRILCLSLFNHKKTKKDGKQFYKYSLNTDIAKIAIESHSRMRAYGHVNIDKQLLEYPDVQTIIDNLQSRDDNDNPF